MYFLYFFLILPQITDLWIFKKTPSKGKRGRKKGRISTCKGSGEPQEAWCTPCRGVDVSRRRCVGPKVLVHTPTEQALSPLPTTRIRKQTQFLAPEAHCGMGNTELLSRARQTFQRSDKVFLAFGEDLRRTLDEAEFVERDGRRSVRLRGRSPVLRELTDRVHKEILELIV